MIQRRPISATLLRLALLMVVGLAALPGGQGTQVAQAAGTGTVRFELHSARNEPNFTGGSPITKGALVIGAFKYIITKDDVGIPQASAGNAAAVQAAADDCNRDKNPFYPDGDPNNNYAHRCNQPAVRSFFGSDTAPVLTGEKIDGANQSDPITLPDGKYLVSITADNFKIDGEHFTVSSNNQTVKVSAQPFPLPLTTIKVQIFNDSASTNGQMDVPGEDGLPGFEVHLNDVLGPVTTDWFGNPICTEYRLNGDGTTYVDPNTGKPVIVHAGGKCLSQADGVATIPNMGPDRYTVTAVPPQGADAANWIQTTTLEGNHDWDIWPQEGGTGYDTEALVAGEPFPMVAHGFAHTMSLPASSATGEIKGRAVATKVYVPPTGGLPYPPSGYSGAKIDKPIDRPWVALSDLNNGDQQIYLGRGLSDGTFDIKNVPDGDYQVTVWDGPQEYILDLFQTSVQGGQIVDLGNVMLAGWFTQITGTVFIDTNGNGKQDAGERGLPRQTVLLKTRNNSVVDQGVALVQTDNNGHYVIPEAYPLGSFLVEEVYNDRFQTTGVTFQADNQPTEKTILSSGVDINFLPIIGLSARIDWGVKPYAPGTNGGIVGTVTYDTTRNELDPRFAATEDYQPGIPNFTVKLYAPVPCNPVDGNACATAESGNSYEVDGTGAFIKNGPINIYTSETWHRPNGCVTRDIAGNPIDFAVLPTNANKPTAECIEAPLQSVQVGTFGTGSNIDFASDVDGNYGFGDACLGDGGATDAETCADGSDPAPLLPGDYLVEANSPQDAAGNDLYKPTREEDINVFSGDQFVPQIPPPACAGALHTVDVMSTDGVHNLPDGPDATENPGFADIAADPSGNASPYEGQQRPLCNMKMVPVQDQKSIAPNFNFFTDVPIPGRLYGLVTDDLNLSTNQKDLLFGEKAGVPAMPVGFYDYSGRLVTTVLTDKDGYFDVQLPSVSTYNCPLPAGPCPNVYRLVGNDPGTADHLNPTYNPQYRVITTNFQVWPGLTLPADLAPVQIGVTIEAPGSNVATAANCALDTATPQLFTVSKPYLYNSETGAARDIVIKGQSFGTTAGIVTMTGPGGSHNVPINTWGDQQITVEIPNGGDISTPPGVSPFGTYQLSIKNANGASTVNGLSFHVLGGQYNPRVVTVNSPNPRPQLPFNEINTTTVQAALDAAATYTNGGNNRTALVVVFPGANDPTKPTSYNPRGAYYENIVMHSPVKLQGVGPGGVRANGVAVPGSALDGILFGADGDSAYVTNWYAKVNSLTWSGNQNVYDGSVVYVLAQQNGPNAFGSGYKAAIDGFDIQGGDQLGFPNNINNIGGLPTGQPGGVTETQGGGIFANAYANNLQITNNVLKSNGGAYGGAIRLGTPDLPAPDTDNHNYNALIAHNRIFANGGTNLAGAIALFNGSNGYEITNNDLCGNFSAEYGGAISHFGLSNPTGSGNTLKVDSIHDNRIYFNRSYDEGGAIMIAGAIPADPSQLSPGAGPVDIYNNLIQANLANDDGGGIRFLMAGNSPYNVYNNMIVSNISTHEGGGVALDDAPNVRFYNNTVMNNLTTATAATSNGQPAPAGLSTGPNSDQLQATLGSGAPSFSNPLLFNNIFWENRAGSFTGGNVGGIGLAGDPNPINYWDLGGVDPSVSLAPTNSILQVQSGVSSQTNQVGVDPKVKAQYPVSVDILPWRNNLAFTNAIMVAVNNPITLDGNYHLPTQIDPTYPSPAMDLGAISKATVNAPAKDIDGDTRFAPIDSGADEVPAPLVAIASVTPTALAFGNVPIGTTSAAQPLTLSNTGGAVLNNISVAITAPYSRPAGAAGGTCVTTLAAGASCTINVVFMPTIAGAATGSVVINASVAVTGSAVALTGTGVTLPLPTLGLLDNFNRVSANTLGANWSQFVLGGAALRVGNLAGGISTGYAFANSAGNAYWNVALAGSGANQGAAFTFASAPSSGTSLILRASGTPLLGVVPNFIRVRYTGSQVIIETTTSYGANTTNKGTFGATFGVGDKLTAVANADGSVDVWKTTAANVTTYLGRSATAAAPFTSGGRIGMQLPASARVDDFLGGNLVPAAPVVVQSGPVFATALLDTFALQSGPVGTTWRGQTNSFAVQNSQIAVGGSGYMYWKKDFKANQEARLTFTAVSPSATAQGLLLKVKDLKNGLIDARSSAIQVFYDATTSSVVVQTMAKGQGTVVRAAFGSVSFASGDILSAQALADGTVKAFKNGTLVGSINVTTGANPWPSKLAGKGGSIGVAFNAGAAAFDDFGGGTLP